MYITFVKILNFVYWSMVNKSLVDDIKQLTDVITECHVCWFVQIFRIFLSKFGS